MPSVVCYMQRERLLRVDCQEHFPQTITITPTTLRSRLGIPFFQSELTLRGWSPGVLVPKGDLVSIPANCRPASAPSEGLPLSASLGPTSFDVLPALLSKPPRQPGGVWQGEQPKEAACHPTRSGVTAADPLQRLHL